MAQAEVVTVRMSRGNVDTPWGFSIVPPVQISGVVSGSLADRAGLLNGDTLMELEGCEKPDFQLAKQLLSKAEHKIELVVFRNAGHSARLWKPAVTENTEYSRFQHSIHNVLDSEPQGLSKMPPPPPPPPPPPATAVPLRVSLEHQPQAVVNVPGFNVKAQPFGARQEVKHLQYNSPMPLYSPQSAAEQYLQQTGGLFGTDPHVAKMTEVPAYLRSETLRLIQEDEATKEMSHSITIQSHPAPPEPRQVEPDAVTTAPQCYSCGRIIQGVMCRAFEHALHPECFRCATCGTALKNQGHLFVSGKFYCTVHGEQFDSRNASATLHPDLIVRSPPSAISPKKTSENARAFYQPEIMTRKPLSISPTPWKTQSPISPSNRGIPSSAVQYGQDLRNETYLSPAITTSSVDDEEQLPRHPFDLTRHAPLPEQIYSATSPRRRPSTRQWPPESPAIRKFWRYDNKVSPPTIEKVISLTSYIKELDEEQHRPPSPKRHLLRGEVKKGPQPQPRHGALRNENEHLYNARTKYGILCSEAKMTKAPNLQEDYPPYEGTSRSEQPVEMQNDIRNQAYDDTEPVMRKTVYKQDAVGNTSQEDATLVAPLHNETTQSLLTFAPQPIERTFDSHQSWTKKAEILEEVDLATEKSFAQQNEEDECGSLPSFDKETTDFLKKGAGYFCDGDRDATPNEEERSGHGSEGEYEMQKVEELVNWQEPKLLDERNEAPEIYLLPPKIDVSAKELKQSSDEDRELWMKEELEEARRESENGAKLEQEHLEELRNIRNTALEANTESEKPQVPKRSSRSSRAVLAKQRSLEAERQRMDVIRKIEEVREQNIIRLAEIGRAQDAVWHGEAQPEIISPCEGVDKSSDFIGQKPVSPYERVDTSSHIILVEQKPVFPYERANTSSHIIEQKAISPYERVDTSSHIILVEQKPVIPYERVGTSSCIIERESVSPYERVAASSHIIERDSVSLYEEADPFSHTIRPEEQENKVQEIQEAACKELQNNEKLGGRKIWEEQRKQEEFKELEEMRRWEEIKRQDENDKRLAIESIERHQRQLQEQQVQLSQLLDNAIIFLKNLDTEILKKSPDASCFLSHRERVTELEQYDNLKPEDVQRSAAKSQVREKSDEQKDAVKRLETKQLADFDTPSDRIMRAIQELDSVNNNTYSSRSTQERHTFQSSDNIRGRGVLQAQGSRIPYCEHCKATIRGAYVLANGVSYCPEHFVCANKACNRKLLEIGFVEEKGRKYCEHCFETLIAPHCAKCNRSIVADCLNALQKQWHPECFVCTHCQKPFGNSAFFLEQGQPYCENDWNALFTTRCIACNFPIEAGDRWVEALGSAFHSNCFNCTACNINLEGESFYAKNGAPYCKLHA